MANLYNEDRKLQFITDITQRKYRVDDLKSVFNISYKYETMFQKDVADFSFDDLKTLFTAAGWTKSLTFYGKRTYIIEYYKWCIDNMFTAPSSLEEINRLEYADIANNNHIFNQYFKSVEDIMDFVKIVYFDKDESYSDRSVCCAGLVWYGVSRFDIPLIKPSDFDFDKLELVITNSNKVYKLSQQFADVCKRVIDSDKVVFDNRTTEYKGSSYLFRRTKSDNGKNDDPMTEHAISTIIFDINKAAKKLAPTSPCFGKVIDVRALKKYQIFEEAYNKGIDLSDHQKAAAEFWDVYTVNIGKDNLKINYALFDEYTRWVEIVK